MGSNNKKNEEKNPFVMGSDQGGGKFALIGLIIGAVILIYFSFMSFRGTNEISYNEFLGYVNNENGRLLTDIRAPLIINEDGKITGRVLRHDGEKPEIFTTRIPPIWDGGDLYKKLQDNNIIYKSEESQNSMITMILVNVLPIILMVMLLIFMTRQMQGGAGGTMNFG